MRLVILSLLFYFLAVVDFSAQELRSPVARFSFNDGNDCEELSRQKARLVGATYTSDRFGNPKHAVHLGGNPHSYINLGNNTALKPREGSVSLWLLIELETMLGRGGEINPVILTKCARREDYYEAYCIYYLLRSKRIEAASSRDSLKQSQVYSGTEFSRFKWHHLVITYDHRWLKFYIDGVLEGSCIKGYDTQFDPQDSVVVGTTASVKNARSLNGIVDDIEFFDGVLTNEEIIQLYNAPNPNKTSILVKRILWCLSGILLICLLCFFIRYRVHKSLRQQQQRLEMNNIMLETELRVNRALMNPHFVFNSLNALQNFILKNENQRANSYLVKFSKLMRRILESNMSDSITLEFEIQILKGYLEIESLRFEENIQYSIYIDPAISPSSVKIPVMMLQPFVENAIWHGLLKKEGEKLLTISFFKFEESYILCRIEDNGTGRKKTDSAKQEKSSLATGFIEQRLLLLNRILNLQCSLNIDDKPNNTGTIVKILLPIVKK